MPFRSRIMAAGNSPQSSLSITGEGTIGIIALGSTQTDAKQLSTTFNVVAVSSASTGVKLPPCEEGAMVYIYSLAGQDLKIYTNETTGVTINAAVAGSTGVVLGTTKTAICFAPSYNTWVITCALTST